MIKHRAVFCLPTMVFESLANVPSLIVARAHLQHFNANQRTPRTVISVDGIYSRYGFHAVIYAFVVMDPVILTIQKLTQMLDLMK